MNAQPAMELQQGKSNAHRFHDFFGTAVSMLHGRMW